MIVCAVRANNSIAPLSGSALVSRREGFEFTDELCESAWLNLDVETGPIVRGGEAAGVLAADPSLGGHVPGAVGDEDS